MWCFRVFLWGGALLAMLLPGFFFLGLIGRVTGLRPGRKPGEAETVFGWIGAVVLGGIVLGICIIAGLIDFAVSSVVHHVEQQQPQPRPIAANINDDKLARSYLSNMAEFNV